MRFVEDIKSHHEEGECDKRNSTPFKRSPKDTSQIRSFYHGHSNTSCWKVSKKEPPTVIGLEKFDFHYIPKPVKNMEDLGMTLENHAHNQVQVQLAAQNISQRCAKKTAPPEIGEIFQYRKFFCRFPNNVPVKVEKFSDG